MTKGALADLLGDYSVATFFSDHFGKKGLHARSKLSLFGWDALNEALNRNKDLPATIKVLVKGNEVDPVDYLTLLRDLRNGISMLFSDVDRYDPNLGAFLSRLSAELGCITRFNAYLSSPGIQGRHQHYDAHDVFVLQIEGSKRWIVHKPTDPFAVHARKDHRSGGGKPQDEPYLDVVLRKGDVLYLPRGHWHDVRTESEVSLHLTLGAFVANGADFLDWLADECTEIEQMRKNMPVRLAFSREEDYRLALDTFIAAAASAIHARASERSVADDYRAFLVAALPNRLPFNFPYAMRRPEFSPEGPMRASRKDFEIFETTDVRLVFSNRVLDIPKEAAGLLRRLMNGETFQKNDVLQEFEEVGLEQATSLISMLAAEGLIVAA